MIDSTAGLYGKYLIYHRDGTPISPGFAFVLRPEKDPVAYIALTVYATETENAALGDDLLNWLSDHPEPTPEQRIADLEETP